MDTSVTIKGTLTIKKFPRCTACGLAHPDVNGQRVTGPTGCLDYHPDGPVIELPPVPLIRTERT